MDVGNRGRTGILLSQELESLETVKALHQTVVSLRAALEQSRAELHSLRLQFQSKINPAIYTSTIEKLSLENHVLRQRVLSSSDGNISLLLSSPSPLVHLTSSMEQDESQKTKTEIGPDATENENLADGKVETKNEDLPEEKVNVENGEEEEEAAEDGKDLKVQEEGDQSLSSMTSHPDGSTPKIVKGESEESEELDDIELIFTTDDTKELSELQEDLVSIAETENWQKGSHEKCNNLRKTWAHSVLVETDISKCGVVDENGTLTVDSGRRNTLPNPVPYRPIIHREALSGSKGQLLDNTPGSPRPVAVKFSQTLTKSPKTSRPILVENNSNKQESEAQTDITALPAHWRSESYLAHKVSHNFTTLPSKFALPVQSPPRKHSLKLCEKTQEARRVLLSDINFTSMVPELSRSADHLCNEAINASTLCKNYPRAFSYMKNPDSIMSPGYLNRAPWSPCDCNHRQSSWECYHGSIASMHSPSAVDLIDGTRRRHSMRPSTSSTDTYWGSVTSRPNWSVPSSPTQCRRSRSIPLNQDPSLGCGHTRKLDSRFVPTSVTSRGTSRAKNRVTFQEATVRRPGRSLPDLRLNFDVVDSGEDSTESLIDESEEYLRRSIDSMFTSTTDYSHFSRHRRARRHSDPDHGREFEPPKSAQPFLARVPRDLKLDYWVKVINGDGRVVVGRVRYIGPLPGRPDTYVGVEIPHGEGTSDGTFEGRRFFNCDPDCGIFVPFKKVVLAWST